ncbi:Conserved_hypothetical protein [Hexamita inflata]|uniref:Myb-like DNA-binding domain-containing protein n=1 Tax=Hexamita inflata TaxID=28002 RepID=A0AA86TU33_9EUKA|nr:Conserved hypothetical protein [Hexamita inflata]
MLKETKTTRRNYSLWTVAEKEQLKQIIQQYLAKGDKLDWEDIQQIIKTKTQRQCYDQYVLQFKSEKQSSIRHDWTKYEENKLVQEFNKSPFKWETIQHSFVNISISQLKNKYNSIKNKYILQQSNCNNEETNIIFQLQQLLWNHQ